MSSAVISDSWDGPTRCQKPVHRTTAPATRGSEANRDPGELAGAKVKRLVAFAWIVMTWDFYCQHADRGARFNVSAFNRAPAILQPLHASLKQHEGGDGLHFLLLCAGHDGYTGAAEESLHS
jgi:hypothetical protein